MEGGLSPKHTKALRRSIGGAAVTIARNRQSSGVVSMATGSPGDRVVEIGSPRSLHHFGAYDDIGDELVPRQLQITIPAASESARLGYADPVRVITEMTVRRHNKGSYALHMMTDDGPQFVLAARAEGGGVSSFLRLYSEPAAQGLTPGKAASSYIGKLAGGATASLWMKQSKVRPPSPLTHL
jgi:hypothetical protein